MKPLKLSWGAEGEGRGVEQGHNMPQWYTQ